MIYTFPDTGGRFRRNEDASAGDAHEWLLTVAGNTPSRHPEGATEPDVSDSE